MLFMWSKVVCSIKSLTSLILMDRLPNQEFPVAMAGLKEARNLTHWAVLKGAELLVARNLLSLPTTWILMARGQCLEANLGQVAQLLQVQICAVAPRVAQPSELRPELVSQALDWVVLCPRLGHRPQAQGLASMHSTLQTVRMRERPLQR